MRDESKCPSQVWEYISQCTPSTLGGVMQVEAGAVDYAQEINDVRQKAQQKDPLEAIRTRSLLGLEVGHGVPDRVRRNDPCKVFHDCSRRNMGVLIDRKIRGRGLWEMCKEKQVRRILPRTGRCTIRFEKGGYILCFLTLEDAHELASSSRAGGPFHLFTPRLASSTSALLLVTSLGTGEFFHVGGSWTSSLKLIEALNTGTQVPHPLSEPWVVRVTEMSGSEGTAFVQSSVDCCIEFDD